MKNAALIIVFLLVSPTFALAQVTFQPTDCEFRVWFVAAPTITSASVPTADGAIVETEIAELNPILDDGYAHYFRAECTAVSLVPMSKSEMIGGMQELVRGNRLEDATVWVEELASGQMVGRVRASIDTGQRSYVFDIRRYLGEISTFDVWAGAERYPTEGISMFFKSVAYRGDLVHE